MQSLLHSLTARDDVRGFGKALQMPGKSSNAKRLHPSRVSLALAVSGASLVELSEERCIHLVQINALRHRSNASCWKAGLTIHWGGSAGKNLQAQYERWQPRARYKMHLDPTMDDVKKLAASCRRAAKVLRATSLSLLLHTVCKLFDSHNTLMSLITILRAYHNFARIYLHDHHSLL